MSFASSILALGDGSLPASFDGLKSQLPLDWIRSCLREHGVASVRRRKLPVEQVIWLLVGMALYRDRSIPELVDRLDLVLPERDGTKRSVAKSAITPARDRLGADPMRSLFESTAEGWALPSSQRHLWHGLKVLGVDGTTLRIPDSPENREEFGQHAESGYPLVRVVALMALRSRLIMRCAFAGGSTGESTLAQEVLAAVPDDSVTILDRYYHNYSVWRQISAAGSNRHWLVPAREDLKVWTVMRDDGDGSSVVEIRPSVATRRKNPDIPDVMTVRAIRYKRPGFRERTLLTSLLDEKVYPTADIIALYHERWEQELAYREIKAETLEGEETIRSQSPERVRQELWGLFIAYNIVRREMEAVAEDLEVPPARISFRAALALIRDLFFWAEVASPGKFSKMILKMRFDLRHFVLPPRRERSYPRAVKMQWTKYPTSRNHPAK